MGRFCDSLARLRRESGFPTPYAFYHRNGGKRAFPFTFAYYLKIERGQSLPRPEWLPVLLTLLRIPPTERLYRRFVTDYLRDLFKTEEAYSSVIGPLLREEEGPAPKDQAAKRLLSEKAYHVTPEQFRALLHDPATYWSFECLVNDRGTLTPEQIAEATGQPLAKIHKGLERLAGKKLAKKTAKGRWTSPLNKLFYVFPRSYQGFEKDRAKLWTYEDAVSRERGAEVFNGGILMRAEEADMRRSAKTLSDAVETASSFSVEEEGEDTGLYLVQTRVRRLFPF